MAPVSSMELHARTLDGHGGFLWAIRPATPGPRSAAHAHADSLRIVHAAVFPHPPHHRRHAPGHVAAGILGRDPPRPPVLMLLCEGVVLLLDGAFCGAGHVRLEPGVAGPPPVTVIPPTPPLSPPPPR